MDTGFILNRRPYRDNSYLVDIFCKDSGRITCVARIAKKRGKIMKGTLEPFRQLRLNWIGRGEVQTLTLAEEKARFRLPTPVLCKALYLNELLLKLVPKYAPAEETFESYVQCLHILAGETPSLMDCEIRLLDSLGYCLRSYQGKINVQHQYSYSPEDGVLENHQGSFGSASALTSHSGVPISANLLIKLVQSGTLDSLEQLELRSFLDRLIDQLLQGKQLKSRKLAFGH